MTYTITLEDCPYSITEQAKHNAETKFQRTLERNLGEPEDVLQVYRAWQNAMETDESELSTHEKTLAQKWVEALYKAQTAGLSELGECEAYFDLRVQR